MVESPSPNHGGLRTFTFGVIIHSTRGSAPTQEQEFAGTLSWFASPASRVSAHRVLGYDGNGAICVPDDLIAWHASAYNAGWLGVELTQPTIHDPFSAAQYAALRDLLRDWSAKYGFPLDRNHIKGHDEIDSRKSDPGPMFDWNQLEEPMADYGFPALDDAFDVLVRKIGAETVGTPLHVARYMDFAGGKPVLTTQANGVVVTWEPTDARLAYQVCTNGRLEAVKLDDGAWIAHFYPSLVK